MDCALHQLFAPEKNIFFQIANCQNCKTCVVFILHLREMKIKEIERYGLRLASATSPGAKPGDFPSLYCGS